MLGAYLCGMSVDAIYEEFLKLLSFSSSLLSTRLTLHSFPWPDSLDKSEKYLLLSDIKLKMNDWSFTFLL